MNRFYVENIAESDKAVVITGPDVNHIANVLRLAVGDEIMVSDGSSRDYLCRIASIDTKTDHEVVADIIDMNDSNAELPAEIYLFQGVPKGDKLDLIIQKTVELGVHKIIPVMMERTIVKLDDKKMSKRRERYQGIAEAAAKQSGRGIIPEVSDYMTFKQAAEMAKAEMDFVLMPYESAEGMEYSRKVVDEIVGEIISAGQGQADNAEGQAGNAEGQAGNATSGEEKKKIGIFIGPEGGFAASEVELMESIGGQIISLGHRILRTETAGMATLAILSYMMEM